MQTNNQKYIKAQHKVMQLKKFYKHLTVFILINLIIIVKRIYNNGMYSGSLSEEILDIQNYRPIFLWTLILLIHAFKVFGTTIVFSENWHNRKINQYMSKN